MAPELSRDNSDGNSPLIAAFAGSMDFVVPFIREVGSACYANKDGDTLLHAAADGWQYRMVDFLLISGAELNAQNKHGDTALHMVTRSSELPGDGAFISDEDPILARSETFATLLLRRADTRLLNVQGATPLHLAAHDGDLFAINQLAQVKWIDEKTAQGATALAIAVGKGHVSCAHQLIQLGANVEFALPSGRRVIDYIRESDNPNMRALGH